MDIILDPHRLILPQEHWHLIDSKSFRRDWNELLRQWRIWKKPFHAYELMLWEREKNELRRWWYSLSRHERESLIGRRADGEFSNIVLAMGKMPKFRRYQRGNFSCFPAGTTRLAAPSETLTLSASNNDAFNIDFSPPGNLDAGFGALRDGTLDRVNSAGQNQINNATDWIAPKNSTIGDGYEIFWNTLTLSFNDENFTEDTWTGLTVGTGRGRYVGHSTNAIAVQRQFEFDIGIDGTSTGLVNQDYNVECGDLV